MMMNNVQSKYWFIYMYIIIMFKIKNFRLVLQICTCTLKLNGC